MAITAVIIVITAYLIGSINFAIIFSSLFIKKDIRKMGSGNAGTTNVMRNGGFLPGACTFICDALKGFIASYLGSLIFQYIFEASSAVWAQSIYGAYICGAACMLGHVFPIFFQFKGGKGVATSVGIFAVCCPMAIIIGLVTFAIVTILSRMVSLASIIATVVVMVISIAFCDKSVYILPQIAFILIMGFIVIIKHTENIKRLLAGTESKIGKGGKNNV